MNSDEKMKWIYEEQMRRLGIVQQAPLRSNPAPRDPTTWPMWAKELAKLAQPGDRGVGDVAARMFGKFGGEKFKSAFKALFGFSCGCSERQEKWNMRFPIKSDERKHDRINNQVQ